MAKLRNYEIDVIIGHTDNSIIDIEELKTKISEYDSKINVRHIDVHNQASAFRDLREGSLYVIGYIQQYYNISNGLNKFIWSIDKKSTIRANGYCVLMYNIDKKYYKQEHPGTFVEGIYKPDIDEIIGRIKDSVLIFKDTFNVEN